MTNPYISRGPVRTPDMFFGRRHELEEIAAFLRGNQSVSIIGARKIGKTSLLFHLLRPATRAALGLADDTLFAYLDCEVLGEGQHEEIFAQFAGELAAALDEQGLPPEAALQTAQDRPTRLAFEAALRKLNQRGLRVVLVLDEFERLSNNPHLDLNFFNALRSAAGRYQLAFLTASARPLIELTYSGKSQEILSSPFFNIFAPLFLGLLDGDEARQLISRPAEAAGQPFPEEVQRFIYQLVGGHPLALQVACFHALAADGQLEVIEHFASQELRAHFEYYWRNLSAVEQDTLRRLSEASARASHDTTLRAVVRDLAQKSLLVAEGGVYCYPGRAWEQFVAAQTSPGPTSRGAGGLLTGARLGQHEVLELLGRGGMAEVYRGEHTRLGRVVAIKVLSPSLAAEADFRGRFEREARAVAALKHSNIVQVYDFGEADDTYYMVMEYLAGQSLAQRLSEARPLTPAQMRAILREVAAALDYAHSRDLVHRDIKPSNVMLEPKDDGRGDGPASFRAVLTDFGIAKMAASGTGATRTGLVGTVDYMAPEQISMSAQIDGRADVYALGVMAYQMFAGRLPFSAESAGAVLMAHLQTLPPDPRQFNPDLPGPVVAALLRALSKDPAVRFPTAGELASSLG